MRPRLTSVSETLITPLSIFNNDGIKILSITAMNAKEENPINYKELIFDKVGSFDHTFYDNEANFVQSLSGALVGLQPELVFENVLTCNCGKFEEVSGIRMYNQRRVQNQHCTYCKSDIFEKTIKVLKLNVDWNIQIESFNKDWLKKDFSHFKGRKRDLYKISKNSEPIKFQFQDFQFGLKHQIVWAYSFVYLSEMYEDNEICLHFVEKVSNLSFLCLALAKTFKPELKIHLKGLPIVWLGKDQILTDSTPSDIERIKKGFLSNRKELRV